MNTNRLLVGLVIALVVAFLLSSFVYKQFQKLSTSKPTVETQPLVVASVPLPLGTRLDAKVCARHSPAGARECGNS